jgi:hypothetical protein
MNEDRRGPLADVAQALIPLHKSLIDVTRAEYERDHGRVPGPGKMFQLLVHDPFFAWLRPMSGLMAQIDEILDDEDKFAQHEAAHLRQRVEELIVEGSHPFAERYLQILQAEADVVLHHAALRKALSQL